MSSGPWSTHEIEWGTDTVTKRFPAGDRPRQAREWRALTLLARHAPGLAPTPLRGDAEAVRPTVVMSRLAGAPLRGATICPDRTTALAEAVARLHGCVPASEVAALAVRPGQRAEIVAQVRSWREAGTPAHPTADVAAAVRDGLDWLDSWSAADPDDGGNPVPAVFGPGDGNLANYLWDGVRVRVVDFEDSGRSDRAFELAEITEHVSGWVTGNLDVPLFLSHFDLTPAEAARLPECRRLLALVWLFLLSMDDPDNPRNPPGTAARQARRLRGLLG
ncbi:aminoglycoside phosphotransferase family protein [Embleya sp. NBC_00888]|uniref:phosphotransferase family protein n=1 Tax=Embleya sp. NBC_00888 TaxID=2975960 RepID=UPI00386B7F38|nr:aminoglycoside phosphotransferase family protein [Embleya sp. NBC_00888]